VRLQVADRGARLLRDPAERRDLLGDLAAQQVVRHVHATPAEALAVVVRHLGADHDPATDRRRAHRTHRGLVTGMEPAGHVCAGHEPEQALVVGDALAQVGVQVDPAVCWTHPPIVSVPNTTLRTD
jgi:hypothetical protein